MRKLFISISFLCILLLLPPDALSLNARVTRVIDGDTLMVFDGKKHMAINLFAVDCPELNQPYGKQSKEFTEKLVLGRNVEIWTVDKTKNGKALAWIFTRNVNLNKELLTAGLAWHNKMHTRDPMLAAMEMRARAKKLGLWKDARPTPPWNFTP